MSEQADLILDGPRMDPANLTSAGYSFIYPTLDSALLNLLKG